VGINSDDSVKRLKGNDRPYNDSLVRQQQLTGIALGRSGCCV